MKFKLLVASVVSCAVCLAAAPAWAASHAAAGFSAHGSAEQVYATGLKPNARVELFSPSGHVATRRADSLGGVLFRKVKPGPGYKVREDNTGAESGPLTVHSDAAAPWDPSVYNQKITDCGYQYLTTRDGTKLAIDVHPPTGIAGVTPANCSLRPRRGVADADRVLGLWLRRSRWTGQRDRRAGQRDGLRRRGREHARHGMLGRSV